MLPLTNVFMTVYGQSKVLFEQLIQSQLVDFFLPRFSLLYTKQPAIGPYTHHYELNQYSPISF